MKILPSEPTEAMWRALWPLWHPHEGRTPIERRPEAFAMMKDEFVPRYRAMSAAYVFDPEAHVERMARAFMASLATQGKMAAVMSIMPENANEAIRAALRALMEGSDG